MANFFFLLYYIDSRHYVFPMISLTSLWHLYCPRGLAYTVGNDDNTTGALVFDINSCYGYRRIYALRSDFIGEPEGGQESSCVVEEPNEEALGRRTMVSRVPPLRVI